MSSGTQPVRLLPALRLQPCAGMPHFYMGVWGSELQSSRPSGRHVTDLDISPAPVLLCFVILINILLSWVLLLLHNLPILSWDLNFAMLMQNSAVYLLQGTFFFWRSCYILSSGSAVLRVTRMNNVLSLPCRGSVSKHSSQVHPRDGVSEILCANTTKYWHNTFKLTQVFNNFTMNQTWFYMSVNM